jgi:hypothetical protein
MADLLAAASLLLTVITILYSLWYPEISDALKLPIDEHPLNNEESHRKCRALLVWKIIPLSIVATALVFINLPDAWQIASGAAVHFHTVPPVSYSAVRTAFVVVEFVLAFLAGHTLVATILLREHVKKLNPKR